MTIIPGSSSKDSTRVGPITLDSGDQEQAAIAAKQLITALKILATKVPPKSFLASKAIAGINVLFILEAAEILTGDPFSLNGIIKTFLLVSAYGLASYGRVTAKEPLAIALPGSQKNRPITPMTNAESVEVRAGVAEALSKKSEIEAIADD